MKKTILLPLPHSPVAEQETAPHGLALRDPWVSQFPLPEEVVDKRYRRRHGLEVILLRVLVVALLAEVVWSELILFGVVH